MSGADPIPFAQALIRCASVTPADAGAQAVLEAALQPLGFTLTRLPSGGIANLHARIGTTSPHLCFAGHTDVVPAGEAPWSVDPFAAVIRGGTLIGRGAVDMKGAIAAFVAACADHLGQPGQAEVLRRRGSISLLITGDEEGVARDGTARVLEFLAERGEIPDFCVVGEPTNQVRLGDTIKIGRRGSLNVAITVHGTQGHVAYPDHADNPAHRLVRALAALIAAPLDAGSAHFEPSSLQITSIDIANPASNLIPARASARLNIRFNDLHRGDDLAAWLRATLARHAARFDLVPEISGEAFLTDPAQSAGVAALEAAIAAECGGAPARATGGGTSDARFIARYCPVAEFGLVGLTMHQADERVEIADLWRLKRVYARLLAAFLAS